MVLSIVVAHCSHYSMPIVYSRRTTRPRPQQVRRRRLRPRRNPPSCSRPRRRHHLTPPRRSNKSQQTIYKNDRRFVRFQKLLCIIPSVIVFLRSSLSIASLPTCLPLPRSYLPSIPASFFPPSLTQQFTTDDLQKRQEVCQIPQTYLYNPICHLSSFFSVYRFPFYLFASSSLLSSLLPCLLFPPSLTQQFTTDDP